MGTSCWRKTQVVLFFFFSFVLLSLPFVYRTVTSFSEGPCPSKQEYWRTGRRVREVMGSIPDLTILIGLLQDRC